MKQKIRYEEQFTSILANFLRPDQHRQVVIV